MSLFPKNSGGMLPNQPQRPQKERKPATKQDKLWLALVLGCMTVSTFVYFFLIALSEGMESLRTAQILGIGTMVAYAAVGAGFVFAYVIYNRAFTRDGITPEMLPDTMSEQQKADFIQSGIDRKRKSKWMIVVFLALLCPLAIDFLILTAIPTLLGPIFG
ncbi:MAG: hypothetical protein IKZ16_00970 [Clostridia bacterium]|nr:hypothetical protein [Clostridia bacterium]MBR5880231.1 hypothetical protein [Clostridia bacterium]